MKGSWLDALREVAGTPGPGPAKRNGKDVLRVGVRGRRGVGSS